MEDRPIQKELFKEFEAGRKKNEQRHSSILPKNYLLFNVSHEQIIVITIAVIMLNH